MLKARGLRPTPQRIAVLSAVVSSSEHPSAEDVHLSVRRAMPHLSLATVYKALAELRRVGQIRALPVWGKIRFDFDSGPHHHLVCELCGRIEDLAAGDLHVEGALPEDARPGFEILSTEVVVRSLCPDCRNKNVTHGVEEG